MVKHQGDTGGKGKGGERGERGWLKRQETGLSEVIRHKNKHNCRVKLGTILGKDIQ